MTAKIGKPHLRIDLRQDDLDPRLASRVAERSRDGHVLARRNLVQRADDHQHEIRHFLQQQAQHQSQPARVADGRDVGREGPAGEPRRDRARDPARGRDEEREADRESRSAAWREPERSTRRSGAAKDAVGPRAKPQRERDRERATSRGRRSSVSRDAVANPGYATETVPRVECERVAADRRQIAECRQQRADEARADRQHERADGERGHEAQRSRPGFARTRSLRVPLLPFGW